MPELLLDEQGVGVAVGAMSPIRPNVIDEFTREALAIEVDRSIDADGFVDIVDRLSLANGAQRYMRFDNGPEFVAHAVRDWCRFNSTGSLFIDPGSPWQNAGSNRSTADYVTNCSTPGASTRCWKPA